MRIRNQSDVPPPSVTVAWIARTAAGRDAPCRFTVERGDDGWTCTWTFETRSDGCTIDGDGAEMLSCALVRSADLDVPTVDGRLLSLMRRTERFGGGFTVQSHRPTRGSLLCHLPDAQARIVAANLARLLHPERERHVAAPDLASVLHRRR